MPVPDELSEAVTPMPRVLLLMSLMISLREVAPDEVDVSGISGAVGDGDRSQRDARSAIEGADQDRIQPGDEGRALDGVARGALVRPRSAAASEPFDGAMLSVPLPPLVSVSVMPLPAELMAAVSFDPPTVLMCVDHVADGGCAVSETLMFVPSDVVTTKSGLPAAGGRDAVAVVELAERCAGGDVIDVGAGQGVAGCGSRRCRDPWRRFRC